MDGLQHLRFVAFALAGSDILVEVDQAGGILFCAGATQRLLGRRSAALEGEVFATLFPTEQRPTVAEITARLTAGERLAGMRLELQGPEGRRVAVAASGMSAMKGGSAMQISLRRRDSGRALPLSGRPAEDLAALVAERAAEADLAGEPCVLCVLQLPRGPSAGLLPQALARLRAWTLWGDSLLALPGERIALVLDGATAPERLEARLSELTGEDPGCLGVMAIDCQVDAAALLPALQREIDHLNAGQPLAAVLLSEARRNAARAAAAPLAALRAAISRDTVRLLFQPAVNLRKWTVHHYEVLARLGQGEAQQMPERFLRDAAQRGMATDLDMTICRAAVRALDDRALLPADAHVAINVSAASLAAPGFADALLGVLASNPRVLDRVLIEVGGLDRGSDLTEVAAMLRQVRAMNCRITLDDLLSGGPDLMAVQRLHPDFVKVDAACLSDALKGRAGVALLRAVSQLCDDLGIGSIAKRVEDQALVGTLCELSMDLAQGYCFTAPRAAFPQGFVPRRPEHLPPPAAARTHAAAQALVLPPTGFGRHALAKSSDMPHRRRP